MLKRSSLNYFGTFVKNQLSNIHWSISEFCTVRLVLRFLQNWSRGNKFFHSFCLKKPFLIFSEEQICRWINKFSFSTLKMFSTLYSLRREIYSHSLYGICLFSLQLLLQFYYDVPLRGFLMCYLLIQLGKFSSSFFFFYIAFLFFIPISGTPNTSMLKDRTCSIGGWSTPIFFPFVQLVKFQVHWPLVLLRPIYYNSILSFSSR